MMLVKGSCNVNIYGSNYAKNILKVVNLQSEWRRCGGATHSLRYRLLADNHAERSRARVSYQNTANDLQVSLYNSQTGTH